MTPSPAPAHAPGTTVPALAIALSAILWGTWWWPMRMLEAQGLPGDWASLVMYAAATAALLPLAWRRRARLRAGGVLLLAVGGSLGCVLFLWNLAVLLGDVVRVTLLFYLAPVWATLLGRLILKDRVRPLRAVSIAFGLGGAAVVLGFPDATGLPLPRGAGDWLGVAAGALFALSLTLARLGATRRPDGGTEGLGGFEQSFVAFAVAAVGAGAVAALAPMAEPTGAQIVASLPLAALIGILWLLPQTFLVLWGAARFDPGRTAILMLLEVVAAAVSATLGAGEAFVWRDGIGCALVLLAGVLEARDMQRASVTVPA